MNPQEQQQQQQHEQHQHQHQQHQHQHAVDFLNTLLAKKDLIRCIELLHEVAKSVLLYNNGVLDDLVAFLWTVFYDFYCEYNIDYAKTLQQLCAEMSISNVHTILTTICHQWFNMPISSFVFKMRYKNPDSTTVLYKGTLAWLSEYDTPYHTLLRAIKKEHHSNVYYYIKKLLAGAVGANAVGANASSIIQVLCNYYKHSLMSAVCDCDAICDVTRVFAVYAYLMRKDTKTNVEQPQDSGGGGDSGGIVPPVPEIVPDKAFNDIILRQNIIQRLTNDTTFIELQHAFYDFQVSVAEANKDDDDADVNADDADIILVKTREHLEKIAAYIETQLTEDEWALYSGAPPPEAYMDQYCVTTTANDETSSKIQIRPDMLDPDLLV